MIELEYHGRPNGSASLIRSKPRRSFRGAEFQAIGEDPEKFRAFVDTPGARIAACKPSERKNRFHQAAPSSIENLGVQGRNPSADSSSSGARHAKLRLATISNIRLSNSAFHRARDLSPILNDDGEPFGQA